MSSTPSLTKIIFKPCGLILIISLLLGLIPPFALAENRYYDPSSSKEELCGDEQDQDGNGQAETLSDCACPEQVTSEEFTKIRSFITESQLILIERKDDNSQEAKYFPWDKTGKNNLFCPLTDALLYYLYQELAKITPPKATTSNFYYFHNDHLSGTTVVTDEQGNLVEVRDYYPYGEDRPLSKTAESIPPPPMHQPPKFDLPTKNIPATPYGFTGKEQDTETGLHYFGSRFYNAAIGRFTQQDPVARDNPERFLYDPQQLNTYSYARNNPISFSDPRGEEAISATVIAAVLYATPALMTLATLLTPYAPALLNDSEPAVRATPGVADALDIVEAVFGQDVFTGESLDTTDKILTVVGAVLPWVNSKSLRGVGKSSKQLTDKKSVIKGTTEKLEDIQGQKKGVDVDGGVSKRKFNIERAESPIWGRYDNYRDGIRTNGQGKEKRYYQWDHIHNDIEVYDRRGKHLGSQDPITGDHYKSSVEGRKLEIK